MKPRLLDLFCGAGGAAKGYQRAGFYVIGVDSRPQPHYCGDEFIEADALDWGITWSGNFDAVHASPPCQRYSAATTRWNGRPDSHPDLIPQTRALLRARGLPYVIENVPRSPLLDPVQLCGSRFGLGVRRHRLFESNLPLVGVACAHGLQPPRYPIYDHGRWYLSSVAHVFGHGGGKSKGDWPAAMAIDWPMTNREMAQAIPPAYTEYLGRQILELGVVRVA